MLIFAATVTDKSSRLFAETLPWLILLLLVVIVGGVIIFLARRYVRGSDESASAGFTLHELRELHKSGELSDEQFARAKAQMIGRISSERNPKTDPQAQTPPGNAPESKN